MLLRTIILLCLCLAATCTIGVQAKKLQVFYAGFGRSSIKSLKVALERLGLKTFHGSDVLDLESKPIGTPLITNNFRASLEATESMGYDIVLDLHAQWWREIKNLRPDAKIIIIIQEFEKWEASIGRILTSFLPLFWPPLSKMPYIDFIVQLIMAQQRQGFHSLGNGTVDKGDLWEYLTNPHSEKSKQLRKQEYDQFVKGAMKLLLESDPEQTFFLDFKKGYLPLCEFLEINDSDCPSNEPLPHHVNKPWEVNITICVFVAIKVAMYVIPILLLGGILFLVIKKLAPSNKLREE